MLGEASAIAYARDVRDGVLIVRFTDVELMDERSERMSNGQYQAHPHVILDYTGVTDVDLPETSPAGAIAFQNNALGRMKGTCFRRSAMVIETGRHADLDLRIAKYVESIDPVCGDARVFSTLDAALDWLAGLSVHKVGEAEVAV